MSKISSLINVYMPRKTIKSLEENIRVLHESVGVGLHKFELKPGMTLAANIAIDVHGYITNGRSKSIQVLVSVSEVG
jgi:hypothetical protein